MTATSHGVISHTAVKARNVFLVLLGTVVFLLKRQYAGPLQDIVHAYAGNFSISFALYFVFLNLQAPSGIKRLLAATIAFAAVELFEVFNGFGVMANAYDPVDLLVNAVGIAFAFGIDALFGSRNTKEAGTRSL